MRAVPLPIVLLNIQSQALGALLRETGGSVTDDLRRAMNGIHCALQQFHQENQLASRGGH